MIGRSLTFGIAIGIALVAYLALHRGADKGDLKSSHILITDAGCEIVDRQPAAGTVRIKATCNTQGWTTPMPLTLVAGECGQIEVISADTFAGTYAVASAWDGPLPNCAMKQPLMGRFLAMIDQR